MDKIVLIEDDPGIRTVIRLALKGAGFTSICETGNGSDGLAIVQREKPALVILDLMLPGMDGLAVCSAIRRTPSVSGTPIVMLTARTAEEDVVRGLELGADDIGDLPDDAVHRLGGHDLRKFAFHRDGELVDHRRVDVL